MEVSRMETMFLDGLQAYYAPVMMLSVFIYFIYRDMLLEKRVRTVFLVESLLILLLIMATWADRCLSVVDATWGYRLRTLTTFINFAISPATPLLLRLIYTHRTWAKRMFWLFIPAIVNVIVCASSIVTGSVFYIDAQNNYTRGPLFIIPFFIAVFYLVGLVVMASKQEKKRYRKEEMRLLSIMAVFIIVATLLEIIYVIRFMVFSTTIIGVMLYFMLLSRQKMIFDPLTGAYTRPVYMKKIEQLACKRPCTIAVVDINGLKQMNDTMGHARGDEVIVGVVETIMMHLDKHAKLYRIGGDEFIIIDTKHPFNGLEACLIKAQVQCKERTPLPLSFAFGIETYSGVGAIGESIDKADERMYQQKQAIKEGLGSN